MQNKRRLQKHLLIIYIIYFAALAIGFSASFLPELSRGWQDAQRTLDSDLSSGGRTYYVHADLVQSPANAIRLEGMPDNIKAGIGNLDLHVTVPENYTLGNSFKSVANSGYVYLLLIVGGCSFLAIFILIALIINSLRASIRKEQPLSHRNIGMTRLIGILIIVAECCSASMQYLSQREVARLLASTAVEVSHRFPLDYWNVIVGILFLFMAEVFTIGTQLSEEQRLTI